MQEMGDKSLAGPEEHEIEEKRFANVRLEFCRSLLELQDEFGLIHSGDVVSGGLTAIWPVYMRPSVCKQGLALLAQLIRDRIGLDSFHCICGVPTSGNPLAINVALALEKSASLLPKDHFAFLDWDGPKAQLKGRKVLLVDSVMRSGLSASISFEYLQWAGANPIGVACLFYDDEYDEASATRFFKTIRDEKFWYVVRSSELSASGSGTQPQT